MLRSQFQELLPWTTKLIKTSMETMDSFQTTTTLALLSLMVGTNVSTLGLKVRKNFKVELVLYWTKPGPVQLAAHIHFSYCYSFLFVHLNYLNLYNKTGLQPVLRPVEQVPLLRVLGVVQSSYLIFLS